MLRSPWRLWPLDDVGQCRQENKVRSAKYPKSSMSRMIDRVTDARCLRWDRYWLHIYNIGKAKTRTLRLIMTPTWFISYQATNASSSLDRHSPPSFKAALRVIHPACPPSKLFSNSASIPLSVPSSTLIHLQTGLGTALTCGPPNTWKVLVVDDYSKRLLESVYKIFDVLHMNVTGEFVGERESCCRRA